MRLLTATATAALLCASLAAAQTPPPADAITPTVTPAAAACAQRAYALYAQSMAAWLRQSAARIGESRQEFIEVANLHAQAESVQLSRQAFRVKFLALNAPQRLRLDKGVAAVGEFGWERQDEWRLRSAEPDYGGISDQAERSLRDRDRHPRLGPLERYLREGYLDSPAYVTSLEPLAASIGEADRALQQCLPLLAAPEHRAKRPSARIE